MTSDFVCQASGNKEEVKMITKTPLLVPSRRRFLLNVLPAGTVFCLGAGETSYLKTTKGQLEIKDERVKALWTKGQQFMEKGYT
jgi:hypothetical protein